MMRKSLKKGKPPMARRAPVAKRPSLSSSSASSSSAAAASSRPRAESSEDMERQYKAAKTEVTTFLDGTKEDRDLQKRVEQTARFALLSPAERLATYGNYGAAMAALPPAVRGHPQTK